MNPHRIHYVRLIRTGSIIYYDKIVNTIQNKITNEYPRIIPQDLFFVMKYMCRVNIMAWIQINNLIALLTSKNENIRKPFISPIKLPFSSVPRKEGSAILLA